MSDISISTMTIQSMALDNQMSGPESIKESTTEIASGFIRGGSDSSELAVAGAEIASRTNDYLGTGPDLGSTGTDFDIQQAISSSMTEGIGTIADKII
ncbi:MAG: hypothetical protein JEY79_00875 [Pseudodesulfovibrio sp.]|nr:hypothetical protein [Pseudodesulfovibrio sp.]